MVASVVWPSGRQFYGATESYWVEIVGGTVPGGDGFDRINIMSSEISLT